MVVDDSGRTPLQRAVLEDNAQVCRLLIDVLGSDTINMVAGSEVTIHGDLSVHDVATVA